LFVGGVFVRDGLLVPPGEYVRGGLGGLYDPLFEGAGLCGAGLYDGAAL